MRTLCPSCAQERKPTAEEKALFKSSGLDVPKKLYNAAGCEDCEFYGYKGRIAIFEVAIINPDTAHLIADGIHQKQLRDHFRNNNINSMLVDGLKKVAQGMTSMDELYRVCDFRTET